MTKLSTLFFAFIAFSISVNNLAAQSTTIDSTLFLDAEEVVVTATRSLTKVENLPLNIAVINKRQIEENQSLTPVEALQYIPGVTRQSDGGLASTPIIRGL